MVYAVTVQYCWTCYRKCTISQLVLVWLRNIWWTAVRRYSKYINVPRFSWTEYWTMNRKPVQLP